MRDYLTFEQCCALDCERNMVVTAGPGAGKTRVLTERFCHLMLTDDELDIGEIVALTFTEKAAGEMKARIYMELSRMLHELQRKEGSNSSTVRRLKGNLDGFSSNRIGTIHSFCAYLLKQYPVEAGIDLGFTIIQGLTQQEMILAAIQSAISWLARENSDDLTELIRIFGNRWYLLEGVKHVIEHPVTFRRVLETRDHLFGKADWKDQVFTEYCASISDGLLIPYYHGLRQMNHGRGQLEEVLRLLNEWYLRKDSYSQKFGVPSLFADLRRLARERPARASRLVVKRAGKEISYLDLLDSYYPDLFAIYNPDYIYEKGLDIFLRLARSSLEAYQQEKGRANALDFADLEARTLEFLTNLYFSENQSLITRVQGRFKYIMVDEFQDTNRTQWEIIRLLVTDKDRKGGPLLRNDKLFVVGDKRQAIYRFRGADVTVFDAVTKEILQSNAMNRKRLFFFNEQVMGKFLKRDQELGGTLREQAAIYDGLPAEDREKIQRGDLYLSCNFRSDPELIEFFNGTFRHIFSNKGTTDVKEYECEYLPLREAAPVNNGRERGSVTFYLIPTSKGKPPHTERYSRAEREASLIADIIARIMGKKGKAVAEYHLYPSIREKIEGGALAIGVLFFAYTHIKTFETLFREEGLPFMVNRGRGFYRSEEVMEVVQLLQYLADKEQRISLLAALRGSIFGVTDSDIFDFFIDKGSFPEGFLNSPLEYIRVIGNQLKKWRVLSSHLSIPELIRMILHDRGSMAILSAHPNRVQRIANMEKLIEIGRKFEVEGSGSLPDFVSYCLRMAEEEDDEGEALVEIPQGIPIHLMTIHAAKGLEFPMVIIPELDRPLPREPKLGKPVRLYPADHSGKDPWNDHEGLLPLLRVEYPLVDFRKVFGPLSFMLKRRDALEDVAENRRVFFVGCTRAMYHLILTGYMPVEKRRDSEEPFTSYDYREGAPILDLMDDIWKIRNRYQEDTVGRYPKEKEYPLVVWESPTPQQFTGVGSPGMSIHAADFRLLDEKVRKVDFTTPLTLPAYHQLSPTSLALYKSCPIKFYYKYWLAIPEDPVLSIGEDIAEEPWGDTGEDETVAPRIIGTIVHAYLERHIFGSDLDRGLLDTLFSTFFGQKREVMLLERTILERIKARVTEMVLTTTADEALSRLLAGVMQYSELPFVFNNKTYTLQGRIDKLFKVTGDEGWAILDWKTGDPKDIDPARFAREHYFDLQLACYRVVVERLKNTIVQAMYLYFTSPGRLVKIDYRGDPGEVINNLMEFTEEYKAHPDQVGKRIRRTMEREGMCSACSYCNLGVC